MMQRNTSISSYPIILVYFLLFITQTNAQHVFQFAGKYQGENVYIQNPLSDSSAKYCTWKIQVNDFILTSGFEQSAYEIRLDTLGLKTDDSVTVTLFRHSDCMPKIINRMITPKPTYEVRHITLDSLGMLKWTTEKESGKLMYVVEQFVWNKWISVGEVEGKGSPGKNEYEFQIKFHSGINKFRVKQHDINGKAYPSKAVEFDTEVPEPKLKSHTFSKSIEFGFETRYQLYDAYGNLVMQGVASSIDTHELKKGLYYLNYDKVETEMIKR